MPGVKAEFRHIPPLDADQKRRIADLYRRGLPVTMIQARFGKKVMGKLLKDILEEHGVPHRGNNSRTFL